MHGPGAWPGSPARARRRSATRPPSACAGTRTVIFLNLAFSTQAAYAAPLILLAQTRQADRDHPTSPP